MSDFTLTSLQLKTLRATVIIEIIIYLTTLVYAIYVTNVFLIKTKFYKQFHLTTFYTLVFICVILRILNLLGLYSAFDISSQNKYRLGVN